MNTSSEDHTRDLGQGDSRVKEEKEDEPRTHKRAREGERAHENEREVAGRNTDGKEVHHYPREERDYKKESYSTIEITLTHPLLTYTSTM